MAGGFSQTVEQQILRDATVRFTEASCPLARVRALAEDGADPGPEYRRQAADLGWFAMLIPEELGGGSPSGDGLADAAVLAEERGRLLQPLAFAGPNAVIRGLTAAEHASVHTDLVSAVASGRQSVAWAVAAAGGDGLPGAGVQVAADGESFVLTGTAGFVHDADRAEWVLVTAQGAGLSQFLVPATAPGVRIHRLAGLDVTRVFADVHFDRVVVDRSALVGTFGEAAHQVEDQFHVAVVLTLAESIGAMGYVFDLAVDYAKSRIAFGRPIGSFQAVKHLLADTAMYLETARAMLTAALEAAGSSRADSGAIVSMAKSFIGDCGIELTQNCFQVFGGIGYTWEHDQHLYLRRLAVDAMLYGDPAWHRERVCQLAAL